MSRAAKLLDVMELVIALKAPDTNIFVNVEPKYPDANATIREIGVAVKILLV